MDSQVAEIKDRLNIVDIVGQYVTLRRAGRTHTARCPFHNEKTPSFHVSPERGTYKCFGCGEGGDIFTFVEKMEGVDFATALQQLAQKAGVKLAPRGTSARGPQEKERDERLKEVCAEAVNFFESVLATRKDVQDYLHSRGVHDETIKVWRLGYAPAAWEELSKHLTSRGFAKDEIVDAGFAVKSEKKSAGAERPNEDRVFDRFRGRIMFPIFDAMGQPVAVSGRFFEKVAGQKGDDEPAKYVNSPETALFKKGKTLYGLDHARAAIRKADCILLVEGQFDLILSHQSGLPFTVALSGTALTPEHLNLLGRLSKRLVLALDGDAAGVRAGLRSALMAIEAGFEVKVPTFEGGKDPADLARENPELLKAAIRTSRGAVEFFLDALRPGAKDARAYARLVEAQVLPLVKAMGSKIEQEQHIRIVANKLNVSEDSVRAEVAKVIARPTFEAAADSPHLQAAGADSISGFERKAAMLLFRFGRESEVGSKLAEIVGAERLGEIEKELGSRAEELRFRFDAEVGEHTSEEAIAQDMLSSLEAVVAKERFKMKFL
ncbi:MAG TPA: DNA primase [Candidatus Paceibacterota bacterium]|nr:DNA primase [Candidatus Paceibacterota bacterium]